MLVEIRIRTVGVNRIENQIASSWQEGRQKFRKALGTQIVDPVDHDEAVDDARRRYDSLNTVSIIMNPETPAAMQKTGRANDTCVGVESEAIDGIDSADDVAQAAANFHSDGRLQRIRQFDH